jgi:hypothetical protein
MSLNFKKTLNSVDLYLIAINLIPIWGVWFMGWNAHLIFVIYCLESIIAGIYTILKLWISVFFKNRSPIQQSKTSNKIKVLTALFLSLFFCFHFGLFIFVQLSIFFGIIGKINGVPISIKSLMFNFFEIIPLYAQLFLLSYFISYGISFLKNFIADGAYKTKDTSAIMISPYKRIFVQQFLVIFGAVVLLLDKSGKFIIFIFALVKIWFDVFVDYQQLLNSSSEKDSTNK